MAGPWQAEALVATARRVLSRRPRSLITLLGRLVEILGSERRPSAARVAGVLLGSTRFRRACVGGKVVFATGVKSYVEPIMWPSSGRPSTWDVPAVTTPDGLARLLGIGLAELHWMADCQARERRQPPGPSRRYDYRWEAKRSGSLRLIESPRPRLKAIQRRFLREVLGQIPPHDAAHGFREGRSVRTCVEPHVGRRVVARLDLRDFFPSITAGRVSATLLAAGYPEAVARLMAGLCTNTAPSSQWDGVAAPGHGPDAWRSRTLYRRPHLPQGAPTSPALANLAAYRIDLRLAGLARSAGASYTRYADDLLFSGDGDLERCADRFLLHATAIVLEEGFATNPRKTQVLRRDARQQVAGVVVNDRPNVARPDYDALKATLYNCVRSGPGDQNRGGHPEFRAHLLGRIGWVASLNPKRGEKLRALFDRVAW